MDPRASSHVRRLGVVLGHLDAHGSDSSLVQHRNVQHNSCLFGSQVPSKVVTADEAAACIPDSACITVGGFVGTGCPEAVLNAVRKRFDDCKHPTSLSLFIVASAGDYRGRGLDRLAVEGLLSEVVYAWIGSCPSLLNLVKDKKVQAWNLPIGTMSFLIRDVAAKRVGLLTKTGLGTFVDPREKGGKVTSPTQRDLVELVQWQGEEYLWYKAPKSVDIAIIRGTTADLDGNVSFEHEALLLDHQSQAFAAHNSGGLVIVQVKRLVERGSIPMHRVHIPGAIVDKIVVAASELHHTTFLDPEHDPTLSGELRAPLSAIPPLPLNERKAIAHRALFFVDQPRLVCNIGVGMPEGVGVLIKTHAQQNRFVESLTITTEAGVFGGIPQGKARFGTSRNAAALIPAASMLDFYNGGGIDLACLGMAEVDAAGNVNVSSFGNGRMPGCGGFIDVSQSAKRVLFAGTFTGGGLQVSLSDGRLRIIQEGRVKKFCKRVLEKTFAATSARGREIWYLTERAVFRLREGEGLELMEIAPGIDCRRDVLDQMEFVPIMKDVRLMDARIFSP